MATVLLQIFSYSNITMKIKYKLDNIIDTKRNRQDIEYTVEEMVRVVGEIYKEYDAEITFVKYDSSTGSMNADIIFTVKGKGFFPLFSIDIALSISLTPISLSRRVFSGYFMMDGVSKEFRDEAETHGVETIVRVKTDTAEGSIEDKIKELFKKAEPDIEKWKGYILASDIFLF